MSDRDPIKPPSQPPRVLRCDEWADLIADALDGTLPPAEAAAFARHHSECAFCAQVLKETQQGRDWMRYLAVEPEVPADLLNKILTRTTGLADDAAARGIALPAQAHTPRAWQRSGLPMLHVARQFARHAVEPRLMMTLAMAFFSIALTLNLTGIHLSELRPGDLEPSHLRATVTRQYYAANEQVTKYYLNLRLVYEMEARVRELRRSTEAEPAALQTPRPAPDATPQAPARDGSGKSTVPKGDGTAPADRRTQGKDEAGAPAIMAGNGVNEVFRALRSSTEDQAEGSLV